MPNDVRSLARTRSRREPAPSTWLALAAVVALLAPVPAEAVQIFTASLDGAQEVPPVVTEASGSATLTLNDTQDRLEIEIQIFGLDLDGSVTPDDANDDVVLAHIHAAPAGSNGPVVFGFIGPNSDTNGDLVIDAGAGTIVSAWDALEGEGTTLGDQLAALMSGGLYFNVHTPQNPGGEIRGQIVPEPHPVALVTSGLVGLAWLGSKRRERDGAFRATLR